MTNEQAIRAEAARQAFKAWHVANDAHPAADPCRDLENALGVTQDGFEIDGPEYWEVALSSARQAVIDYDSEH